MDFTALQIAGDLYSVPKEDYLDLTTKVIPLLPQVFPEKTGVKVVKEFEAGTAINIVKIDTLFDHLFRRVKSTSSDCDTPRFVIVKNSQNDTIYEAYFTRNEPKVLYREKDSHFGRVYYDLEKYPSLAKLAQIIGFTRYLDNKVVIRRRMLGLEYIPDFTNIINLTKQKSKEKPMTEIDGFKELIGKIFSKNIVIIGKDLLVQYKLFQCENLQADKFDLFQALLKDIDPDKYVTYDAELKCLTIS